VNYLQQLDSLLENDELKELKAIEQEINHAWHVKQIFRTDTEARYAVLNDFKFPTKASKYWQAVREQMAHFDALVSSSFELRRKEIDLREIEENLGANDFIGRPYDELRMEINRDELLFQIASMKQVAKDRVREIMQWSTIKSEVNDGSFDDKNVNTHQKESLFKQVLNRANNANPENLSSEERMSIIGLLHMLKDEPINKEFIEKLESKVNLIVSGLSPKE
jgi:uncharacterized protein YjgD (DUF1641 family)